MSKSPHRRTEVLLLNYGFLAGERDTQRPLGGSYAHILTTDPQGKPPDAPYSHKGGCIQPNGLSAKTSKPIMNTRELAGRRRSSADYNITISASLK